MLLPLIAGPAFAEPAEIQMDWLIEGQLEEGTVTEQEAQIVSSYEDLAEPELVYDRFITGNEYWEGDRKITIDSEEGQILAKTLVEQKNLRDESFQHKIRYFDRFSDGYVEIAQALLDPIGDSKYIIRGHVYDYNPNSNLELFVLERGYSLDNLEAIPNDIFTPKKFTLGRELMQDAVRSGEGGTDLRKYSPNYLLLTEEQIQERMNSAFRGQTSQLFDGIMSGEDLPYLLPDPDVPQDAGPESIFDGLVLEGPKFEDTERIRDSIRDTPALPPAEDISLLLTIPVFVALAALGYFLRRMLLARSREPLLVVTEPQADFRDLTRQMIRRSQTLFDERLQKEAYESLGRAIRYYYSQSMGIYREMTNRELLDALRGSRPGAFATVKDWLLLCGSVEYARYDSGNDDFGRAISGFSEEVSR